MCIHIQRKWRRKPYLWHWRTLITKLLILLKWENTERHVFLLDFLHYCATWGQNSANKQPPNKGMIKSEVSFCSPRCSRWRQVTRERRRWKNHCYLQSQLAKGLSSSTIVSHTKRGQGRNHPLTIYETCFIGKILTVQWPVGGEVGDSLKSWEKRNYYQNRLYKKSILFKHLFSIKEKI